MLLQGLADVDVGHHISINQHKVRPQQRLCINVSQHISKGAVQLRGDDVDGVRRGGSTPLGLPVRHSLCITSAYLLDWLRSHATQIEVTLTVSGP